MFYPAYVFPGDAKHAFAVIFPDFPGCNAAADDEQQLPAAMNEAVRAHFGADDDPIPEPSSLAEIQKKLNEDDLFSGGYWIMAEIDIDAVRSKPVRVNISVPETLLARIDHAAERRHMTRSGFLASAAARMLENA
jgi:predicted RNase H-like HicB family nuclease